LCTTFPKRREWVKKRESHMQIHAPSFCFLAPKLLRLLPSFLSSLPPSRSHPSPVAMVSILPTSHLRSGSDLVKLRWLLGWQSPWYDVRVRCGAVLPGDLRPSEFIFFSSYPWLGSCSHSPSSSSCCWRPMTFSCIMFHHTLLHWWRSSSTSARCSWVCGHRCTCFGSSTCCALLKRGHPASTATTSSIGPRVQMCTSPPSPLTSGTTGGMIG
jgi:hypothetical protein